MRRLLFTLCIASSLFFAVPPAHAANLPPSILPSCDVTKYVIQSKSGSPEGPFGPMQPGGTIEIFPEEFGVAPYLKADWEVVDYTLSENCGFDDFLKLFVNLFNWGLYVLSILALFFFFLGGGTLLLSGGSEERIRTGKAILVNTVIGLGIALSSWVIVNLTMNALLPEGQKQQAGAALINSQPWFRIGSSTKFEPCGDVPKYPCAGGNGIVQQIQESLLNAQCYFNPGPRSEVVDGNFGDKTLEAWHNWQRANSKPETDVLSGYENDWFPCFTSSDTPV